MEDAFNANARIKGIHWNVGNYDPNSNVVTTPEAFVKDYSLLRGAIGSSSRTASSVISTTSRISDFSSLRFRRDLENSRVYRRVKRPESHMSFSSSAVDSRAWSIFSGLSLAEISTVSVIALPLFPSDIQNPNHYTFGSEIEEDRRREELRNELIKREEEKQKEEENRREKRQKEEDEKKEEDKRKKEAKKREEDAKRNEDALHDSMQSNTEKSETKKAMVLNDLVTRIKDWKGLRVEALGNLLLFDSFAVTVDRRGKATMRHGLSRFVSGLG